MDLTLSTKRNRGLTLIELFVVMAILTIFAVMLIPATSRDGARSPRIQCLNNLKQVGLAIRVWEEDNGNNYPMNISETNGGTMEFTTGANAFRHFQVMSNELSTPKVLTCPVDLRRAATNFVFLSNSNISFFVGLNATETDPQSLLAGDRNLTNGTPVKNGVLELTAHQPAGWTAEMHNKVGNIALSDGSVQQLNTTTLRQALAAPQLIITGPQTMVTNSAPSTNRLQMPILTP